MNNLTFTKAVGIASGLVFVVGLAALGTLGLANTLTLCAVLWTGWVLTLWLFGCFLRSSQE